ncbi:MAG: beta-ketoacyl-[acyl-carrier-protein] synthase family protein [Archangiaceae bacterium]|nr:beta-ketoacyl-[acyl-carrier-protein] synthase family protein [Archangiaceae bacterium]
MKRVAITGMGVVSALGRGLPAHSDALKHGRSGLKALSLFTAEGIGQRPVGEVAPEHLWPGTRASRSQRLALTAAADAIAGRTLAGPGVMVLGSTTGGIDGTEQHYFKHRGKEGALDRELLRNHPLGTIADRIAHELKLEGERHTFATACSSSANAIGYAASRIVAGAPWALAGGVDALCRITYCGFYSLKLVSEGPCRPFDKGRNGLSLGEAAGFVLLEAEEAVRARGGKVLGWVTGWGCSADAHHMTAPHPEGAGAIRAIKLALEDAGKAPADVHYVNAHGTATPANDKMESLALNAVFGAAMPPVSSTKGATGHTLGAAGAIEAVFSVLAMGGSFTPRTVGLSDPDPEARVLHAKDGPVDVRCVLSSSFGFGGNNTALVLERGDA